MTKFTREKLYYVWRAMKERCNNPLGQGAKNYWLRDITVCDEWKASYFAFREWALSNGYVHGLFLDREDNDKGYNPENCRWVTPRVSALNRRPLNLHELYGESKTLAEWGRDPRSQVSYNGLLTRMKKYKMSLEEAITTPSKRAY